MSERNGSTTSLAEVSDVVRDMKAADRDEAAGLGSLIDWELVKFMSRAGWVLLRLSFTWKDDEVLLVVKLRIDETQYVVFVSRPSPRDCIRTLVRKMRAGSLAMYPDRFA